MVQGVHHRSKERVGAEHKSYLRFIPMSSKGRRDSSALISPDAGKSNNDMLIA